MHSASERTIRGGLLALLLMLSPTLGAAQQENGPVPPRFRQVPRELTATISGTVVDSLTGRPVAGANVAPRWPASDDRRISDPHGRILFETVEPGRVVIEVDCPGPMLSTPHVLEAVVQADTGRTTRVELRADFSRCPTSVPTRRVMLRGVFSSGFEESRFIPCRADDPGFLELWGPEDRRRAWVRIQPEARAENGPRWPESPRRDSFGNSKYYVEWSGVLAGPGSFGHFGLSPYWLSVDTILRVEAEPAADCVLLDQPLVGRAPGWAPPTLRLAPLTSTVPSAVTRGDRRGRESAVHEVLDEGDAGHP